MSNQAPDFNPNYAVHPGQFLQEMLEMSLMSVCDLSKKTEYAEYYIRTIIEGTSQITPELAYSLAKVFNRPAEFWLRLQAQYDKDMIESPCKKKI